MISTVGSEVIVKIIEYILTVPVECVGYCPQKKQCHSIICVSYRHFILSQRTTCVSYLNYDQTLSFTLILYFSPRRKVKAQSTLIKKCYIKSKLDRAKCRQCLKRHNMTVDLQQTNNRSKEILQQRHYRQYTTRLEKDSEVKNINVVYNINCYLFL